MWRHGAAAIELKGAAAKAAACAMTAQSARKSASAKRRKAAAEICWLAALCRQSAKSANRRGVPSKGENQADSCLAK